MTIGLLKTKVTGYSRVMSVMEKRATKVRVRRDTDKQKFIALNTKNTVDKTIFRRWTSLEAAFIDRFEAVVLFVTIYQALPEPGIKLY